MPPKVTKNTRKPIVLPDDDDAIVACPPFSACFPSAKRRGGTALRPGSIRGRSVCLRARMDGASERSANCWRRSANGTPAKNGASPAAVTGDAGSMCTMEVVHLMKVAHIQIVQTVVTFEFPTRAPVTFRSTVAGWRASTCASRAMEHAAAALHPVGWTSAVVVLLARETANITEGGPRTRGSLPPSLSTTTPNPLGVCRTARPAAHHQCDI